MDPGGSLPLPVPSRDMPGQPESTQPPAGLLVERLRSLHLEMVDAVLAGEGLERVAELTAGAAGGPVAIVIPRLGAAVLAPEAEEGTLAWVEHYVADRLKDRPTRVPDGLAAEAPISAGDEIVGSVILLRGGAPEALAPEAAEFLHLAAVASLTEVAIAEAKDEVERNLRGSIIEDLRSREAQIDATEVVRRAARLGCDISGGAVVLCAELTSDRPRHFLATIAGEVAGALAQHLDGRVYALVPASPDAESPGEDALASARRVATRLQRHGTVGVSSFYSDPSELPRAMQEAELVLEVLRQSDAPIAQEIGTGTYRLLFRVLASHPEEVRSFYEDTVAPIVKYDDQYGTDLVGTLESYLVQNCNMNATASAIYAHRHTVAYRLDRVKELTRLDPMQSEDRERLSLGLKAYRIIAPRLPR